MKTRALVQTDDRVLEVRLLDVPDGVDDDGALVRVEGCGVSGSDYEWYRGTARRSGYATYPLVLGHEVVGKIERIGEHARSLWGVDVGDRVAVEVFVPCAVCEACLSGRKSLCKNRFSYSSAPLTLGSGLWGGFAEFMSLRPNTIVHRVPEHVSIEDAVLFGPIGAGVEWSLRGGQVKAGDVVVVLGGGQRGLGCVAAAVHAGASQVIVSGLASDRDNLDLALEFGATDAVEVGVGGAEDLEALRAAVGERGADVVLDVVPRVTTTVMDAVELACPGGTVVLAGIKAHAPITDFVSDRVIHKSLHVQGVLGESSWAQRLAIELLASGRYPFAKMHSHTVGLEGVEAIVLAIGGESTDPRPRHATVIPTL